MQHPGVGRSGHNWLLVGGLLVLLTSSATASEGAQDNNDDEVRPGTVAVEPPTMRSIGLEREIGGDLNRNASVEVYYRHSGRTDWREGLPLFRLQNETVPAENATDPDNANRPPEESAFYYVIRGSDSNGAKSHVKGRSWDRLASQDLSPTVSQGTIWRYVAVDRRLGYA